MRRFLLLSMIAYGAAQCGPGKRYPYPPGSKKCPSGPPRRGGGGRGGGGRGGGGFGGGGFGGGGFGGGGGQNGGGGQWGGGRNGGGGRGPPGGGGGRNGGGGRGGPGGGGGGGAWGVQCSTTTNLKARSSSKADKKTGAKAAALRGNVGCIDMNVLKKRPKASTGRRSQDADNVYGPMEAGFSANNPPMMSCLGSHKVDGGIDTHVAELMVAYYCNENPKKMTAKSFRKWASRVGGLDKCGGHAMPYHYHERLGYGVSSCAISTVDPKTGHSKRIATAVDGKGIYGPQINGGCAPTDLDVCGGRWGVTPDSKGKRVYYYVVQPFAPFTIGCFGPPKAKTKAGQMKECRALYPKCDGKAKTITTVYGTGQYDLDCPCFDPETHANIKQKATGKFSRPKFLPPHPESPWPAYCTDDSVVNVHDHDNDVVVVHGRNLLRH